MAKQALQQYLPGGGVEQVGPRTTSVTPASASSTTTAS
jgi:hypothetical protein